MGHLINSFVNDVEFWYQQKGFAISATQKKVAKAIAKGQSGLLNAPTGSGKTFALAVPLVYKISQKFKQSKATYILWITPLKALSYDTRDALQEVITGFQLPWNVAVRNGDTTTSERQKLKRTKPAIIVITPESLHLLLSQQDAPSFFSQINAVVVDEWHELLGSKRGVQVELAIAWIKEQQPKLICWGISATIGNLNEATNVLLFDYESPAMILDTRRKKLAVHTVIHGEEVAYPRTGHHGLIHLEQVYHIVAKAQTCLVFTNTRAQSEMWYRNLLETFPDLAGRMALHHGSLAKEVRNWVEYALHEGLLKVVVCTSGLDLGVDFRPVDTVIQIGSPKGVARFVQRAGRSGHAPELPSTIHFVPANSLELIEAVALKESIKNNAIERRVPIMLAYDTLAQFMVTLACGPGLEPQKLWGMVKKTNAFSNLDEEAFDSVMRFVQFGGDSLHAYDDYRKIEQQADGIFKTISRKISAQHRLKIGTIFSIEGVWVKDKRGRVMGNVETYFISKLKPGDCFHFAGKTLKINKFDAQSVWVETVPNAKNAMTPSWVGGRLSFSSEITQQLHEVLQNIDVLIPQYKELQQLVPLFIQQQQCSRIPGGKRLLIEKVYLKGATHLFVFPFEGKKVNEAIAMLFAYRLGMIMPLSFSIAANDYGFELTTDQQVTGLTIDICNTLLSPDNLYKDLQATHNYAELLRKKFTEIASVAGMLHKDFPGAQVKQRHLQNAASLIYKVLVEHEPNHILLRQAAEELSFYQFDFERLHHFLTKVQTHGLDLMELAHLSPFALPLFADRLREKLSTEEVDKQLEKLLKRISG